MAWVAVGGAGGMIDVSKVCWEKIAVRCKLGVRLSTQKISRPVRETVPEGILHLAGRRTGRRILYLWFV